MYHGAKHLEIVSVCLISFNSTKHLPLLFYHHQPNASLEYTNSTGLCNCSATPAYLAPLKRALAEIEASIMNCQTTAAVR